MKIRPIKKQEIMLLTDFIYESIFQGNADKLLPRTVIQAPSIWVYVDEFGSKKDDYCFVAEENNLIVGAVWVRCIKGFGHLDRNTPEFAISVYPEYRGKGIGTNLMKTMIEHLKNSGYHQTSLSVQKANRAYKMYLNVGFEVISESEEEFIMVHHLK